MHMFTFITNITHANTITSLTAGEKNPNKTSGRRPVGALQARDFAVNDHSVRLSEGMATTADWQTQEEVHEKG